MAQFDVFKDPLNSTDYPLVLDVQDLALARLDSRIVVPLVPTKRFAPTPITRLNPTATIRGVDYILVFQKLAAISSRGFGAPIASLAARRSEWIGALDLLFTGI